MLRGVWKPIATAGLVAGLMAAGLLTATAASEGNVFKGKGADQSAPSRSADGQNTLPDPPSSRVWTWVGEVEQEDGGLELHGPCGKWNLTASNDEIETALVGLVGKQAFVAGRIGESSNRTQGPTINVEVVDTDKDGMPDDALLFPKCERPDEKEANRERRPAAAPSLLGLLERLTQGTLKDVPKDERFEHFLGAQVALTDADGNPVTLKLTAGVAKSKINTSLTIDPNGPEATMTVTVGSETRIIRPGEGGLEAIQDGDKVIILQMNTTTEAIVASKQVTAVVWPQVLQWFAAPGQADLDALRQSLMAIQDQRLDDGAMRFEYKSDDGRLEIRTKDGRTEVRTWDRENHDD